MLNRVHKVDRIKTSISAGDTAQLKLTTNFYAMRYILNIKITHDNAEALTMTPQEFIEKAITRVNIEAGASNEIVSKTGTELFITNLIEQKSVPYTIDRTAGTDKVSNFILIIDIFNFMGISPKDTALLTRDINNFNLIIEAGSLGKLDVKVGEISKTVVTAPTIDGTVLAPQNKRARIVKSGFKSDNNAFTIDLPSNALIHDCILYVMDGTKVVNGAIVKTVLRINEQDRMSFDFEETNLMNRASLLAQQGNANYIGVNHLNFALGEGLQAINTRLPEESQGQLILDLKKGALSDPVVVAIFNTVEKQKV